MSLSKSILTFLEKFVYLEVNVQLFEKFEINKSKEMGQKLVKRYRHFFEDWNHFGFLKIRKYTLS